MLSQGKQNFFKQYEASLQKPKWKFILTYGLSWVVMVMAFTLPLEYFVFEKGSFTGLRFAASVCTWLTGGLVYGFWLRWYINRKYLSIQKKLKQSDS